MTVVLPNIRRLFVPDPNYVILEADLSGADAQVFAKETGDEALLRDFVEKRDIHYDNAAFMWEEGFTRLDKESHAYYEKRQACKHAVHATHNVGSPDALMRHPSIRFSRDQAVRFQSNWFKKHPKIKEYFKILEGKLFSSRSVTNRFGYRIIYFDRIDLILPQAIPWVNQSTVAEVCFRGGLAVEARCPWVEMLIQVHDSLVFQIPKSYFHESRLKEIHSALHIPVPYPDPLIIPWKLSASESSWGECREIEIK